ncbi:DUF2007 domain-containing protein [Martelella alba]|uniref:DUF2007 domain-containing protein n=1 Tax=Martelella alba TaxID=2590451 RepID=A0A506UH85_9HYPH|nr:DUF2007 domain-containing protein [Martelella alba]TPW32637.1 DUF2007 domain-containing protein [Martelella alba]
MINLMRTNDAVLLSLVESLLKEAGIHFFVADQAMSLTEGSLGLLPRRLMVDDGDAEEARALLVDAGLEKELRQE